MSAEVASGRSAPSPLLAISDTLSVAEDRIEAWLRRMAEAGVDAVQLRDPEVDDLRLYRLARRARELLPAGCRLLVNRRIDLALAAGADGVHLPASGLPVAPLRRRFGAAVLIGRSTHRPEEVVAARDAGADYVTFGPAFPTPSKERYGPPPGLAGLRRAAAAVPGFPILALGGITPARLAEVAAAGAAGAAAIRAFDDPAAAAEMARLAGALWPPRSGSAI